MFLVSVAGFVSAQSLKEILAKGDKSFSKKDYMNALNWYMQAYLMAPEDAEANFKVGAAYLHDEKKSRALEYLERAYATNPNVDIDIDYHLGLAYQYHHQYSKAKEKFEAFKKKHKKLSDLANHKIAECDIGDSLSRHPAYVEIANIGHVINTQFHEYSPLLSNDGNTLIFTSNRSSDHEKIKNQTNFEDIYITNKVDGTWTEPQKISPNITDEYNDAAASLSHDGSLLFLYYEEGGGDIYVSTIEGGEWTVPHPLNKNINSPHSWETSACISADGKKLFFTSNRPGGFGELDIWVSERDEKGEWGKAVNLGPTINTSGHEDAPFIHADGVTLYFSSDGHPTMGSNDIFRSEWKDGAWTRPANMGFPVNSIDYDGFFVLSQDKKTGYFSAMREYGLGNADIYVLKFFDPPPPPAVEQVVASIDTVPIVEEQDYVDPIIALHKEMKVVTVLKGKVIDANTSQPLHAIISLVNNETNHVVARINSHHGTGDFELVIPHGGNYGVSTESEGYLFNSINFDLPQFAEYQEIDTHILMMKAEVGSKVVLKNIFFDTGKAELRSESVAELEHIRVLLVANSHMKVQINGHTDATGNSVSNRLLSLERAEAVVKYLVEKGIDPSRLSAKGFGSEKPLVSNDDETGGREINRRTEIEIIEAGHG